MTGFDAKGRPGSDYIGQKQSGVRNCARRLFAEGGINLL